ncbi:hypothetical protein HTVC111P_gp32 [Pelagibacter phage HTVC111P]|nr:hypothetical protein HTVC111P_gp32 [Pelagibacter phage HTVC111P]
MKTQNEIKEVENKITNLNSFIDNNNNLNLKGEMLDKVSSSIESVVFNEEKLKQLKLKLKKEKLLTLKIKSLEALGVKVVSRERNYDMHTYNYINGFYPERIEVMLNDKVVPLDFYHNAFYISYKDHGGQALFNLFEDKVQDNHLFYKKDKKQ